MGWQWYDANRKNPLILNYSNLLLSGKKENDFFSLYGSRQENSLLRKQNGITLEYYYFEDRVLHFKGGSLSRKGLLK